MATHSVPTKGVTSSAQALTANTVDTVSFADDLDQVDVYSDGTAALGFTVDGSTPSIGGTSTYWMPASESVYTVVVPTAGGTQVKLISTGTPTYSVSKAA